MADQHFTQVNTAEIFLPELYRLDNCLREQERIAKSMQFVLSLESTATQTTLPPAVTAAPAGPFIEIF